MAKLQKTSGMEGKHRDALTKCNEALVEDLEPKGVLPHLIQTGVLTSYHQEKIKNMPTRKDRSEELLTMLLTRGPCAYEEFVKALEKTQPFLACFLLREELLAAEAKGRELESQLQEALNRSYDKQPIGKKRNISNKKKKKKAKDKSGTIAITVAPSPVTTKRTAPGQEALQQCMNEMAGLGLEMFPLTTHQNLQDFCYYLSRTLNIQFRYKKQGSLKLTVHCRSLEILERLWEDYRSGHLEAVAEECLVTDEVKRESDMDTTWLETTILEEDYLKCKTFLTEMSGFNSSTDKEAIEMENIKYKNILFKFQELLLEKLDQEEVSAQLMKAGVLTSQDKDKIDKKHTRKDKTEQLLLILATKGPEAYEEFVKELEKDHCFLACQLLKEEKQNLLYEVKERKWQLEKAMDEKEGEMTAASENETFKDQLEIVKGALLEEEKKLRDQQLEEIKNQLLAERSEKEALEMLCKELKDQLKDVKYAEPRKKVITWKEIVRIVKDIESSWLELGRALELGEAKLRKIDKGKKSNCEKALAVFELWMNDRGIDATVGCLEDSLQKIEKGNITDKLLEPEEERHDYQREVDKLIEETRDQLSVESREKERSASATSQEDSVEALFKELNISPQEESSQGKKTKQKPNKKRSSCTS